MNTRNDIHSPKNIRPEDYTFERVILARMPSDVHPSEIEYFRAEMKRDFDWLATAGWQGGNFATKRTCDHCGAWFVYGVAYHHAPTDKVIVVGETCATKTLDVPNRATLQRNRLASKIKSSRVRMADEKRAAQRRDQVREIYPDIDALFAVDHYITRDIAARFKRDGRISEKQVDLLRKLKADADAPKTDVVTWQPVTEGKRTVTGTILSAKWKETMYGESLKALIHVVGDEKVWGTVPRAVETAYHAAIDLGEAESGDLCGWAKGKTLTFTATFERSRDDECFGFYKRPSKVTLVG